MAQPYNYILDVPNPLESLNQGLWNGFKLGANIDQVKKQQEQYDLQKQQQSQMNQSLQYLAQNPSPENYAKVMTMYPQLSENLKRSYDTMDDGKRKTTLSIASQSYAALMNNQPDIAKQVLNDAATAYENSGQTKDAGVIRGYIKLIDNNPAAARTSIGLMMASTDPDKFKDIYGTLGSEQRANEMQPYNIKESQSKTTLANAQVGKVNAETQGQVIENRYKPQQLQGAIDQTASSTALNYATIKNLADKIGLDRDKLETETALKLQELSPSNIKLSDGAQKIVNDSMIASTVSEQSASQQLDLAGRLESAGGGYGAFSRFSEWIKGATGNQGAMTQLRNEYTRIRSSQAMKMLPPGPATDKDMELAMKGLPPETADASTIASFLRGMAKMNQRDAAYQQMQGEWVNQVGNMGSTKRDVDVLGVKVPSGTTFQKFATTNLNKTLNSQKVQSAQRQVSTGTASYLSAIK